MNTTKEKSVQGTILNTSFENHSLNTGSANESDFVLNITERQEVLQEKLTEHLRRNKKIVRTQICLGCGKPKAPAKFSVFYGVCKSCLQEAKAKGKTAQSNFIARTVNNLHKNLRGALQNA
jgi:hypothetical protein